MKSLAIIGAYCTGYFFNDRLQLKARLPRHLRVGMYTLFAAFYYFAHEVLKDTYICLLEGKADREAAKLHPNIGKGGLEYYDQVQQRNITLRKILKREGKFLIKFLLSLQNDFEYVFIIYKIYAFFLITLFIINVFEVLV